MAAAVLEGFESKNQLAESDPNDRMDCVAVSLADAVQWLTGKSVTGAELKDATYGKNYVGGTALVRYVDQQSDLVRAKYGVSAEVWSGEPTALVAHVHSLIRQGFPVIATIPSNWGTPRSASQLDKPNFSTHCICFYGEMSGGLVAANPWGGVRQSGSDGYWDARLCYRQVWRVYRVSGGTMGVPSGWKDDGATLTAPNGVPVVQGFRTRVLAGWDAENWPLAGERSMASVEYGNSSIGAGTRQDFRTTSLGYTSSRGVYTIWTGQDIRALAAELAQAQATIQQLQAQGGASPHDAALVTAVKANAGGLQAILNAVNAK